MREKSSGIMRIVSSAQQLHSAQVHSDDSLLAFCTFNNLNCRGSEGERECTASSQSNSPDSSRANVHSCFSSVEKKQLLNELRNRSVVKTDILISLHPAGVRDSMTHTHKGFVPVFWLWMEEWRRIVRVLEGRTGLI